MFLVLPFIEPEFFNTIPSIDKIYNAAKCLSLIIFIVLLIRNKCFNRFQFFSLVMFSTYILSSIVTPYSTDYKTLFSVCLNNIGLIWTLDYCLRKNSNGCIVFFFYFFSLLLIVQLITMLLFPNGLYNIERALVTGKKYWLLGHQNISALFCYPAIYLSYLFCQLKRKRIYKIMSFLVIFLAFFIIFYVWSATSIVGLFVVTLLVVFDKSLDKGLLFSRVFKLKNNIIYSLALFILFVLQSRGVFYDLILHILKRDITFTGRTTIWKQCLQQIAGRPLLGMGEAKELWTIFVPVGSAHNRFLQVLCTGGIIYFIAFISFMFFVSYKIDKNSKYFSVRLLIYIIFALLIQMQFESYEESVFWFLFVMAYNIKCFCNTVLPNSRIESSKCPLQRGSIIQ